MTDEAKKVEPKLTTDDIGCYDWQPGNGARYYMALTESGRGQVITWLKYGDIAGPSFLIIPEAEKSIGAGYFIDKMGIGEDDGLAILDFLVHMGSIEEYY